jgi:quercetin dioxygenase-like cupin family protein
MVTRSTAEHEQLVVVQRGTGVVHNGHGEPFAVRAGDVVVVPPHTTLTVELDGPAELLVARRAGDDGATAGDDGPSDWFG